MTIKRYVENVKSNDKICCCTLGEVYMRICDCVLVFVLSKTPFKIMLLHKLGVQSVFKLYISYIDRLVPIQAYELFIRASSSDFRRSKLNSRFSTLQSVHFSSMSFVSS